MSLKKRNAQQQKSGSATKDNNLRPSKNEGLPLLGKNIVLPIANPTGNPYDRANIAKINDENELKGLQVKAELDKLGKPSPSFEKYLLLEPGSQVVGEDGSAAMEDCDVLGEKPMSLSQRFSRIERARPAVAQITI